MKNYDNFINGRFVPGSGTDRITVTNPATGQAICTVPESSAADVESALNAADAAQRGWAKRPAVERAKVLRTIAAKIRENVEPLARVITEEQGKVLGLSRVEVAFTADYFDYMAEWARRIEGEILESDRPGETILLFRQPIGVVGGILPWNFPFFLIARKAAPGFGDREHNCHQAKRRNAPQRREILRIDGAVGSAAGVDQYGSRAWSQRRGRRWLVRHASG